MRISDRNYKVWDLFNNKMKDLKEIEIKDDYVITTDNQKLNFNQIILLPSANKKDKNSNEIFDKFIVKYNNKLWTVFHSENDLVFKLKRTEKENNKKVTFVKQIKSIPETELEIIGHIFSSHKKPKQSKIDHNITNGSLWVHYRNLKTYEVLGFPLIQNDNGKWEENKVVLYIECNSSNKQSYIRNIDEFLKKFIRINN